MHTKLSAIWFLVLLWPVWSYCQASWVWTGPAGGQLSAIIPYPPDSKIWFAVDGDRLYRSQDGAQSWADTGLFRIAGSFSENPVGSAAAVTVSPATGEIAAVTTIGFTSKRRLWFSRDQGKTFQLRATFPFELNKILFHPNKPDVLYGLGLPIYGLGVSIDGGRTWRPFTNLNVKPSETCGHCRLSRMNFSDVIVASADGQVLYASAIVDFDDSDNHDYGELDQVLWTSRNAGKSWSIVEQGSTYAFSQEKPGADPIAFNPDPGIVKVLTPSGVQILSRRKLHQMVAVPGHRGELIGVYYNQAFRSRDGGKSWEPYSLHDLGRAAVRVQALPRPSTTLLVGTDGAGLFRGNEESGFTPVNRGFQDTFVFHMEKADSYLYALIPNAGFGQSSYLFRSTNQGGLWQNLTSRMPTHWSDGATANPRDPSNLLLAGSDSSLWITHDAGETWKKSNLHSRICCYWSLAFNPQNPKEIYAKPGITVVYKSTDGGLSFKRLFDARAWINQIIVDSQNPSVVFLATDNGILKSTSGGTPVPVNSGLPPACKGCSTPTIQFLAPLGIANGYLTMVLLEDERGVAHGRIFRTLDGAGTWERFADPPKGSPGSIAAGDSMGTHLFHIAGGVLYESLDSGKSWSNSTASLAPDAAVLEVSDPRTQPLFVTTTRGVYRMTRTAQ